jgi:hypothetical protein
MDPDAGRLSVTPAVFAALARDAQQLARERGQRPPSFRSGPARRLRRYPSGAVLILLPMTGTRDELWQVMLAGLDAAAKAPDQPN